jgi:head-tail adaptor
VVIFRTRFIDGVENADRVLFAGEPLNIKEIAVTGHNRGLEIRCVRQS